MLTLRPYAIMPTVSIPQEQAIQILQDLINGIAPLRSSFGFSKHHSRWLANVHHATKEVFGANSLIHRSLASYTWKTGNGTVIEGFDLDINKAIERANSEAYLRQLDAAEGLLQAGIDQIKQYGMDSIYEGKNTPEESSELIKILDLAEKKLRKTMKDEPQSEKAVQDKFEALLIGAGIPYHREKERIPYSSKSYQPDFTFTKIDTALEIKLCDAKEDEKKIIGEINEDIAAYKTKYSNIIFVVYDMGQIVDVDRFKQDIEADEPVVILVVKH